jgi:hypothetical protein
VIGDLENGGFLMADVPAGQHSVSLGVGEAQTIRGFAVMPGDEAFFDISDTSRMAGARGFAAGLAGGAIGGFAQALQEQAEAAERHEGPIWAVDRIPPAAGLPVLQNLSLSQ